eukprot:6206777-Pleurochrysis_carterae.AAC.1
MSTSCYLALLERRLASARRKNYLRSACAAAASRSTSNLLITRARGSCLRAGIQAEAGTACNGYK